MNALDRTEYEVYRSEDGGKEWSAVILNGRGWAFDTAKSFIDNSHSHNPSEWLRIVKTESKPIYGFDGGKDWIAK